MMEFLSEIREQLAIVLTYLHDVPCFCTYRTQIRN